jgi:signal transduction histidine kinase
LTVLDITDLIGRAEDAQAIEQHYGLALDASDQSIWDWNPETDQMTIGERFWDQVGRPDLGPTVSFEDFLGLVATADREDIRSELSDRVKNLNTAAAPVARDLRFETLHGEARHFTLTYRVTLSPDGSRAQMTGLVRDVTESRQLRQAIIDARARAEAATKARSNFLAVMSHEIRTPLNGILGTARLLLDAGLQPAQQELARVITESGEALLGIINQILDYSRIESAGVELERTKFDLVRLIEGAAKLMTPDAEAKGLRIDTLVASDVAFGLVGDPGRIRQIVLNLLSNAVKFTSQGNISVSAFPSEESDGTTWSRIEVKDTSIGIAEDALGRVFDEFTQADASISPRYGGSGLGLAICRRLAE